MREVSMKKVKLAILFGFCFTLIGQDPALAASLIGVDCTTAEVGTTKLDIEKDNVIACLHDVGNSSVQHWRSMSYSGGVECPAQSSSVCAGYGCIDFNMPAVKEMTVATVSRSTGVGQHTIIMQCRGGQWHPFDSSFVPDQDPNG